MEKITAAIVGHEAIRLLSAKREDTGSVLKIAQAKAEYDQKYVALEIEGEDLESTLLHFSKKYIESAMGVLNAALPEKAIFYKLDLPEGVQDAAWNEFKGCGIRTIIDRQFISYELRWISLIRFDVRFEELKEWRE